MIFVVMMAMVLAFSMQADAALQNLGVDSEGNRLIYDTDLDITWYDYTNSVNNWQNQMNWADALSVTFGSNNYTDWRLPSAGGGCWGEDCTNGEMGHLFYSELENISWYSGCNPQIDCGLVNTSAFQNLQVIPETRYWYGTDFPGDPQDAWFFDMRYGYQGPNPKSGAYSDFKALAVRDGLAVVPEPVSSTLFIVGGATLGFRRFRKKFIT